MCSFLLLGACAFAADALAQHPVRKAPQTVSAAVVGELGQRREGLVTGPHGHDLLGDNIWSECSGTQLSGNWTPEDSTRRGCIRANLIYIKVPKTASSTFGGVMRRIAAKHGLNGVSSGRELLHSLKEPLLSANHYTAKSQDTRLGRSSLSRPTIHLTTLREPTERRLSFFYYFAASRSDTSDSTKQVLESLRDTKNDIYGQYKYITPSFDMHAEDVLKRYAVVGVTERFDESLMLLKHTLGLPSLCDVLYVVAKNSSDVSKVPCVPLAKQPKVVKDYVASKEYRQRIAADLQIYKVANQRMDDSIQKIGKAKFDSELKVFQQLLEKAQAKCGSVSEECYWADNGCNFKCLDRFCESEGIS